MILLHELLDGVPYQGPERKIRAGQIQQALIQAVQAMAGLGN